MSKSVERRLKIQLGLSVDESDLEWSDKLDSPYSYHVVLHHKPTGMEIEQASECSFLEAKSHCMKELQWRLKHWDEWKKSKVRESD